MIQRKQHKRVLLACILCFFAIGHVHTPGLDAQTHDEGEKISEQSDAIDLDQLKSNLFSGEITSEEEFKATLTLATQAGLPEQILMEAKITRYWTKGQFQQLMAILPQIEKDMENWDYSLSEIFTGKNELKGYYHLFRAYEAKVSDASQSFAENAKESFWNYPELGEILSAWIKEVREKEKMANLVMPMDTVLTTSQGKQTTLSELVTDKKGLLLDFWATWCAPCIALMPELIHKAETLKSQGIVVAGMNTETEDKAESFRKARDINFDWLVEPEGSPFQQLLQIDSIPRMVLVSPQGKVLYNGHPMDPALIEALNKLEVTL